MNLLLGLALVHTVQATQGQAPSLSLKDAVDRALKNNLSIEDAQNTAAKAGDTLRTAKSSAGPSLSISGQHSETIQGKTAFSPGATNRIVGTLSQAIDISGTIRLAVRAANFAVEASRASIDGARNAVRFQVRQAFCRTLQANWVIKIQTDAVKVAERRFADGQQKEKLGAMSKFDLLRLENAAIQARASLDQAQLQAELAENNLNRAMREPAGQHWNLIPITAVGSAPNDSTEVAEKALKSRPEAISLQARVKQMETLERSAANGLKPSLGVQLQQTRNLNPNSFSPATQSTFGFNVTIPILDGGATRSRVASAKRDTETFRIQLKQLEESIRLDSHSALLGVRSAAAQAELARSALVVAKEAARLAEVRFQNGLGVLLDVLEAESNHTKARAALAQANYDYLVALATLEQVVGNDHALGLFEKTTTTLITEP